MQQLEEQAGIGANKKTGRNKFDNIEDKITTFKINLQEQITDWFGQLKINRDKTDDLSYQVVN